MMPAKAVFSVFVACSTGALAEGLACTGESCLGEVMDDETPLMQLNFGRRVEPAQQRTTTNSTSDGYDEGKFGCHDKATTRRIFILRHGERLGDPGGGHSCLNKCGLYRAQKWASWTHFKKHPPKAVFAFNYALFGHGKSCQRAAQTAKPTADKFKKTLKYLACKAKDQNSDAAHKLRDMIEKDHYDTIAVFWEHESIAPLYESLTGDTAPSWIKHWKDSNFDSVVDLHYQKSGTKYHHCGVYHLEGEIKPSHHVHDCGGCKCHAPAWYKKYYC